MDATTTATGMIEPQGVAASGFDQKVYVADLLGGTVYLVTGVGGSTKQAISTGTIPLSQPADVAVNAAGDLYIADYNKARVVVVPAAPGTAPYVLNTGTLLSHPISLTVDFLGDLYIGDSGPDGVDATGSAPGYLAEVPYKGSAFKLLSRGSRYRESVRRRWRRWRNRGADCEGSRKRGQRKCGHGNPRARADGSF